MLSASSLPFGAGDLIAYIDDLRIVLRPSDGDIFLGRCAPAPGVAIDHPAVSRLHARLTPDPVWHIVDYESRNGLYFKGIRIHDARITDHMVVHLGAPDGVAVVFRLAAPPPAARAIARVGRAVVERGAELGMSRRQLQRRAHVGTAVVEGLLDGREWPATLARKSLASALQWPPGAMTAVRRGAAPSEITELITASTRHHLLVDSVAMQLQVLAAQISQLPPATDPGFSELAAPLAAQLRELDARLLADAYRPGAEFIEAFRRIVAVYSRRVLAIATRASAPKPCKVQHPQPQHRYDHCEHET